MTWQATGFSLLAMIVCALVVEEPKTLRKRLADGADRCVRDKC